MKTLESVINKLEILHTNINSIAYSVYRIVYTEQDYSIYRALIVNE